MTKDDRRPAIPRPRPHPRPLVREEEATPLPTVRPVRPEPVTIPVIFDPPSERNLVRTHGSGEHHAVKEMRAKFESIADHTQSAVDALNDRVDNLGKTMTPKPPPEDLKEEIDADSETVKIPRRDITILIAIGEDEVDEEKEGEDTDE